MITRIRLRNFRRHEETEIELAADDQIVVVAGENGAGKTAILEAITYALTGEGRHGQRRLDSMVRRGAELEGMEVELEFTLGGETYRVLRRREGRAASAVLWVNDVPLVEGTKAVTEAVSDVLGMDANGFRLAVVAQQKELDSLARMGGAARGKAMARLLRLDAITRAKDEAREMWRLSREVLDKLPGGEDLTELSLNVTRAEAQLQRAASAESDCRATLAELDAKIAASNGIDEVFRQRREAFVKAEAARAGIAAEIARLEAERATVRVPDVVIADHTRGAVEEQVSAVEREIARGEAAKSIQQQRRMWNDELARAEVRIAEIDELDSVSGVVECESHEMSILSSIASIAENVAAKGASREALREEHASLRQVAREAQERIAAIALLGAECDSCHQAIPHEHVESQTQTWGEKANHAETKLAEIVEAGRAIAEALAALETEREAAVAMLSKVREDLLLARAREGERAELTRRMGTYREQLERTNDENIDIDGLYARKGALAIAMVQVRAHEESVRDREAALWRTAELEIKLADANVRLDAADLDVAGAEMDADIAVAFADRQKLIEGHRGELELLGDLTGQTATAREQVESAKVQLRTANELAGRRRDVQKQGATAAWAQKILEGCEEKLRVSVRPALEACVTDLLSKLSDGRFSAARIANDYSVSVMDDGEFRQVWELSGGEQDLVALALRLGIAEVVAERHGGGVGFLILDEVFGSQDQSRRQSILTALRGLREEYGQIWCISHVGGLEDAADKVVSVELSEAGVASLG
jgi:DNA repair protein SbcC/Rad50